MQSLIITSPHYNYLLAGYKEYLQILGYCSKVTKNWPGHVQEFFHWLENKGIHSILQITALHQRDFMDYLQRRRNCRTNGTLSAGSINRMVSALHAFARYINSSGRYVLDISVERISGDSEERNIVSVAQIKQLYEATFLPQACNELAMGQRDRAILALYYGCGLRRNEGIQLNINDIDVHKKLLFVRKGKGNRQRYVPIATRHIEDITAYLHEGREWFLYEHNTCYQYHCNKYGKPTPKKGGGSSPPLGELEGAFLLNKYAQRLTQPEKRLQYLLKAAEIKTPVTLHGLRHSIATHLLQSGMDIESIARFLGHRSLVSTQIYTHIVNENKNSYEA